MTTIPVSVAVAYHSGSGHTAVLAEAVGAAAAEAGADATVIRVDRIGDDGWTTLDAADAIVFGSPTFMGTASAAFHAFAQLTSGRWLHRTWQDKLAAGFTASACKAGDKSGTLEYFTLLAAQHGMLWVNLGIMPGWHSVGAGPDELNRLGYSHGAAAATDSGAGVEGMNRHDVETAAELGRRVTRQAMVVRAGRRALAGVVLPGDAVPVS